jgi:GntR family transcriptional repressor for pyruvate dehydrogenase complex
MVLEKIRKQNISEQIASRLRKEILNRRIKAGDKLPPERELAEQLGTNRNTLREAIRYLEILNLVSVRQGNGIIVQDYETKGEINLLPYFIADHDSIEGKILAFKDILRFRTIVICEAARMAADKREDRDRKKLRETIAEIEKSIRNKEEIRKLDMALNRIIIEASKSMVSLWLFNSFIKLYEELITLIPDLFILHETYLESMKSLVEAICNGDTEKASEIVKNYFFSIDEKVLNIL